jgi:high affinity Mn2+ porin
MNWSIWEGGAFDYAADQYGYTWGAVAELNQKTWTFRAGYFLVPTEPNGNDFDTNFFPRGQYVAELEERYALFAQPGKFRLTGWLSSALAGSFAQTLDNPALDLDITRTRKNATGIWICRKLRTSRNWRFRRLLSGKLAGRTNRNHRLDRHRPQPVLRFSRESWGRPDDKFGVAGAINGLSNDYRRFLAAAGLGINIGDGQLNYSHEKIVEAYYTYNINRCSMFTLDYQFVDNPAYNSDRGPVSILTARYHAEF